MDRILLVNEYMRRTGIHAPGPKKIQDYHVGYFWLKALCSAGRHMWQLDSYYRGKPVLLTR